MARCPLQRVLEAVHEARPVRQRGERIVERLVAELLFKLALDFQCSRERLLGATPFVDLARQHGVGALQVCRTRFEVLREIRVQLIRPADQRICHEVHVFRQMRQLGRAAGANTRREITSGDSPRRRAGT
jgi:hypothetical protein